MRPTVVSAIYGTSDTVKPLPLGTKGVLFLDYDEDMVRWQEAVKGGWSTRNEPLTHLVSPRLKAKFWKVLIHLAVPDELTLWIDGSMQLHPGWESITDELGDDEAVFFSHHIRDCVYEEVPASFSGRPESYKGQRLQGQVDSYRERGLPEHAGLIASGCSLRRSTPAVRAFNQVWWNEICRWSIQDQLSATPALLDARAQGMRWHYFSKSMLEQPWFTLYRHTGGDTGEG